MNPLLILLAGMLTEMERLREEVERLRGEVVDLGEHVVWMEHELP